MAAFQKAGAVGEEHKKLEAFTGSFNAKIKMWADSKAQPEESTGSAEAKMVLGGRYLEHRFQGTLAGQAFSGVAYTGYDNAKKVYVGVWMDDLSTDLHYTNGKWDATGTVLQSAGKVEDPITGKPKSVRTQARKMEGGQHIWEMWEPDAAGTYFKSMEVTYSRK